MYLSTLGVSSPAYPALHWYEPTSRTSAFTSSACAHRCHCRSLPPCKLGSKARQRDAPPPHSGSAMLKTARRHRRNKMGRSCGAQAAQRFRRRPCGAVYSTCLLACATCAERSATRQKSREIALQTSFILNGLVVLASALTDDQLFDCATLATRRQVRSKARRTCVPATPCNRQLACAAQCARRDDQTVQTRCLEML